MERTGTGAIFIGENIKIQNLSNMKVSGNRMRGNIFMQGKT